jgi:hypothetical protein
MYFLHSLVLVSSCATYSLTRSLLFAVPWSQYKDAWFNLAQCYKNMGDTERALESFDKGFEVRCGCRGFWVTICVDCFGYPTRIVL